MKLGWTRKRLADVCTLQRGFDLPTKERKSGGVPLVSSSGIVDHIDQSKVRGPGVVTGRSGSIGNVFFVRDDFWPLNTALYVKDFFGNDERFVFHLLQSLDLERFASGTGVPTLNRNHVSNEIVFVPDSVKVQRQVAAVLDEASAAIAIAVGNAAKSLANVRELLLNEIDRALSLGGPDWVETNLDSVCTRFEYGTSAKSKPSGSVPVLRMGNIQDGEIDWADLVFSDDKGDIGQLSLRPNDILFNRTNSLEHVGKSAIVRDGRQAIFAGYLIRLYPILDVLDPEFLNLYLNSRPVRAHGRAQAGKSVNQANISAGKLRTYPIQLPPLAQQREIASTIARLRRHAESLRAANMAKKEALTALKRSVFEKAFAGELVAIGSKPSTTLANDNFHTPKGSAQIIAFAYWLHERRDRDKSFKHVKAQKCLHNIENIAAIDLGREPRKFPYGPHDPAHMARAEEWGRENGFFEFAPSIGGLGLDFRKLSNYDALWAETIAAIKPFQTAVERAIEPLVPMNMEEAELFATVHAAWNNLLRDGAAVSDEAIVWEAREDWDQAKTNIPRHKFYETIKLIRKHRMEPDGTGKYVGGQPRLL